MSGYGYASDEEVAEFNKSNADVLANPDEFENWEKLVRSAEGLEGGLNRNSSPQSITAARDAYDRFLARYPLFFGYWKKYADLEFSIAGTEAAEYIYERGVASVAVSVDLWTHYCNFKVDTCHDADLIRELFERGAECAGLDFLAHIFWDKYIEYETRYENEDRVFAILSRLIHIPLHQYARYFEEYRRISRNRSIAELAPEELIQQFTQESTQIAQMQGGTEIDIRNAIELDVRNKAEAYHMDVFRNTQAETTRRWTYEQEVKRPYFHVTELDDAQLVNWTKYLDFEEANRDFKRASFLYERCLVICANYDEYWQRYARWMCTQKERTEEARTIFARASYFFTPIARPAIRMQWALFEEAQGRADVAADIYQAILMLMPDHEEAAVRLANLQLRQHGLEAALAVYAQYVDGSAETSSAVRGALVGHAALLTYNNNNNNHGKSTSESAAEAARGLFAHHASSLADSEPFWRSWLQFESRLPLGPPASEAAAEQLRARVRDVHARIRAQPRLSPASVADLTRLYMGFLTERGGRTAAAEWLQLDALVDGSAVVVAEAVRQKQGPAGPGPELVGKAVASVNVNVNGH